MFRDFSSFRGCKKLVASFIESSRFGRGDSGKKFFAIITLSLGKVPTENIFDTELVTKADSFLEFQRYKNNLFYF